DVLTTTGSTTRARAETTSGATRSAVVSVRTTEMIGAARMTASPRHATLYRSVAERRRSTASASAATAPIAVPVARNRMSADATASTKGMPARVSTTNHSLSDAALPRVEQPPDLLQLVLGRATAGERLDDELR